MNNTNSRVKLIREDITKIVADAIVNAANNSLLGGGGVDGAIHNAAGPELLAECKKLNGCATGDAKITKAYLLPSGYVIHTVGPVWNGGANNEIALLKSCYERCLQIANEYHLKSIAFPAISTGVYRFPKKTAAEIAMETVIKQLEIFNEIETVTFVVFDQENYLIYSELLKNPVSKI